MILLIFQSDVYKDEPYDLEMRGESALHLGSAAEHYKRQCSDRGYC